jgi:hypothetical protein
MASTERRIGNINKIRSGNDRRVFVDQNFKGPERRSGEDRRTEKDRRKKD